MPSTDSKANDLHDSLEIAPDVVLVARSAADFPSLAPGATGRHPDRQPNIGSDDVAIPRVDTTFRATDTSGARSSSGRWLKSASLAFLFALCSALAAAGWQRYGDEAQALIADYASVKPSFSLASWLPSSLMPAKPVEAASADTATPQAAAPQAEAADQAPTQPAPAAVAQPVLASAQPADSTTPAAAPPPVDTAELLQSMARDVTNLNQQLTDLKARIAELKAGQEQLSHDMAGKLAEPKVSEAKPVEPRPTKLGAPPRPLGTLVHRAKPPVYPRAQTAYVPPQPGPAPVQIAPPPPPPPQAATEPDPDGTVVRPPMPVR